MKKIAVALVACVLVVGVALADRVGQEVGTTSEKILPARGEIFGVTWTNGIPLAQGIVVENQDRFYMAVSNVASSVTAPVHTDGVVDGLRYVTAGRQRSYLVIQNESLVEVWFAFGKPAVVGEGTRISPRGSLVLYDVQDAVYAIAESGSDNLVVASEILKNKE